MHVGGHDAMCELMRGLKACIIHFRCWRANCEGRVLSGDSYDMSRPTGTVARPGR